MAKNDRFIVPQSEQKDFFRLVQRANRRIQANFDYIQREDIKSEQAQRALTGDYASPSTWHTAKTVFSRSKSFASEKDYRAYVRHISQWGDKKENHRSVENVREGYYKAIIKGLTTTAIENGNGVLTKNGRLPANLAKQIRSLSLEQLSNWFDHGNPADDIESQGWGSDMYFGVDRGEFVDVTESYINTLKNLFPEKNPAKQTPPKKRKKRGKKGKSSKARKRKLRKKRK